MLALLDPAAHGEPPPAPDRSPPATSRPRPYWLVPAVLMLVLGLWRVDRPELWRDELFTWSAVTRPLPDLLRMVAGTDAVTAPYYLLMHAWTAAFGTGAVALRLPSVLAMAVAAALVARIGGVLVSPRAGTLAGLVFCATPEVSRTAQEARTYAFAVLATAAATLLLVRALRQPSTAAWSWYAAALAATAYAHLFAFTVVLGHAVAVAALTRPRCRAWLLAAGGACLAVAPLAALGARQRGQVSYLRLTTPEQVLAYPETLVGAAAVAGLALALAVAGASRYPRAGWIAGGLAVVPLAALLAAGAVAHVFAVRYLLFTLVGWAVLVGAGLAAATRPARWVTLALVALLGLPAQEAVRAPDGHADFGAPAAARYITERLRPGDGIAYEDVSWLRAAFDYHLPPTGRPRDVLLARPAREVGRLVAVECPDPAACLAGVPRLWLVHIYADNPLRTVHPAKAAAITAAYAPVGSYRKGKLMLTLYERR